MMRRVLRVLGLVIPWGESGSGEVQIQRSHDVDTRAAAVERRAALVAARWERSEPGYLELLRGVRASEPVSPVTPSNFT